MFRHRKNAFRSFLNNTPLGILIGSLVMCLIGASIDAGFGEFLTENLGVLIGGGLTLIAAVLAVSGVFANIASQEAREEEARKRKLLAARAKLPFALAKMSDVCDEAVRYSIKLPKAQNRDEKIKLYDESLAAMALPKDAMSTFEQIVEFHDDPLVANHIFELLKTYQVYTSRWVGDSERWIGDSHGNWKKNKENRTVSWVYLGVVADALFDYARGESDGPKVTSASIGQRLEFRLKAHGTIADYHDEISRYVGKFDKYFG